MDIKRPPGKPFKSKRWPLVLGAVGLTILLGWQLTSTGTTGNVSANQLLFGEVQQGDLAIVVEGYGVLRSSRQKLLTAFSGATVEEIVLKPGALVTKDSVILILSNPELTQEVESAQQALAQEKANLRKLILNQKSKMLKEHSEIAELETNLTEAQFKFGAQSELFSKGIVSRLQFKQTELAVEKYTVQLTIQRDRLKQLALVDQEAVNIQTEVIKQAEGFFQARCRRIDALTVKASMTGVLQRLSVVLGESVESGQQLALVGSTDRLDAHIRVPQTQVGKVQIGQTVIIDTRQDKIPGEVYRIDPAVEEGTVLVEVALQGPMPKSARPELTVEGIINTGVIGDTLYIERPVNARANAGTTLFKLIDNEQRALATTVELGAEVGRFIQVLKGAQVHDTFILSDLSRYQDNAEISIQ
jgi:HlyD family secretion protein